MAASTTIRLEFPMSTSLASTPLRWTTLLGTVVVACALGACASAPSGSTSANTVAAAAPQDDAAVVCSREEGTGSRIQMTRCRKTADVEARRKHDREMAENIPTVVPDVR
jgi:hypothetical protein